MSILKRKYRQVKRFIQFIPHIWKGADWDYRYAVDLFTYQLSRTANYIEEHDRHTTAKSDAMRIRTAVKLLTKVYEEEYATAYLDNMESKYGKSNFDFVESTSSVAECGTPYFDMVEVYENNYTDTELLMLAEEKHFLMNESKEKQKRAHKIAWELIEHNICGWWD